MPVAAYQTRVYEKQIYPCAGSKHCASDQNGLNTGRVFHLGAHADSSKALSSAEIVTALHVLSVAGSLPRSHARKKAQSCGVRGLADHDRPSTELLAANHPSSHSCPRADRIHQRRRGEGIARGVVPGTQRVANIQIAVAKAIGLLGGNMDVRLLTAINDVLADRGFDFKVSDSSRQASENALHAKQSLLDHAGTKNASTGRPIADTRGAAKENATMAALGGGAKSAGGGGMAAGAKNLDMAGIQVQLATYGITGVVTLAEITGLVGIRYAALVRRDRKAARAAAVHPE